MPQHPGKNKGGRLAPDNRGAQAKGVGKNSKRHDLERPATPGLHGSSLQKGDVQALEQGQRIAPIQTQERGQTQQPARASQPGQTSSQGVNIPDAIDFLAGKNGQDFGPPQEVQGQPGGKLNTWQPLLERIALGVGGSGGLASLYINQMRRARQETIMRPAVQINLDDIDFGIEGMVQELEAE